MTKSNFSRVRSCLKGLLSIALIFLINLGGCSPQGKELLRTNRGNSDSTLQASASGTHSNSESLQDHYPKVRAIWVWASSKDTTPEKIDKMLDRVILGRFNTILYYVGSGEAGYQSTFLNISDAVTPDFDPLAYIVKQGHIRGLKVQAWWAVGTVTWSPKFREAHPGWWIGSVDGVPKDAYWLNFSLPEVQQFVGDVVLEIAENYDVDGVHLDYIRYPMSIAHLGNQSFFNPNDVPATVESVYRRLKAARPGVELSAAALSSQGSSKLDMQNWADWLVGNYIDRIFTMAYRDPDRTYLRNDGVWTLERDVGEWKDLAHSERIVSGLQVTLRDESRVKTLDEFMAQVEVCRAGGFDDLAVFDEKNITPEILDALAADFK